MQYGVQPAETRFLATVLPYVAAGLLVIAVGGCGGSTSEIAPVSGIVELDGQPMTGFHHAAVVFTPVGGRLATGKIGPDGTFRLTTYGAEDGAVVGTAKVSVSATVDAPAAKSADRLGASVRWVIPRKFGSADASGMTCEVRPGEENQIRIALKSDGTGSVERQ